MNEAFLSHLWRSRFSGAPLVTVEGEPLTILHPGERNSDSGPDFFNARIRLGDTTWAGNVEIHVLASDWYRHGHHTDPAYNRVILHVVHVADRPVTDREGEPVPTLEVQNPFAQQSWERYQAMMAVRQWIPCRNLLEPGADYGFGLWAPALAAERLDHRTQELRHLLNQSQRDWEETFFRHMAACFGFRINALPFELLAKSVPVRAVMQLANDRFRMESLLYGQAGMLEADAEEEYPRQLMAEYRFLRRKYGIHPIEPGLWKYLRLRPSNFPTIRISQFSDFLCRTGGRMTDLAMAATAGLGFLPAASPYWDHHYLFGRVSPSHPKPMGAASADLLVINGLAPFRFFYCREHADPTAGEQILALLETTRGELNAKTERWHAAGFPIANALQTQALLHLEQAYCNRKRCLECRIGMQLLDGPVASG